MLTVVHRIFCSKYMKLYSQCSATVLVDCCLNARLESWVAIYFISYLVLFALPLFLCQLKVSVSYISKVYKRPYTAESMKETLRLIKNEEWPLYKVGKRYSIPRSTLKDYTHTQKKKKHLDDPASMSLAKIGKPFVMPPNLEIQVVNYILRMQNLGFGLQSIK
jgi:hypothetical protein